MTSQCLPHDWIRLLHDHLAQWGLHRFTTESTYYVWQQKSLSFQQLNQLNELSQHRQGGIDLGADVGFYDLAATPSIIPVLYSQRYGFYETVGLAVASCLHEARHVLDFGCGVGILTTLYARLLPGICFLGIDRSVTSVGVAQQRAKTMGLQNVQFVHRSVPNDSSPGIFDAIISTHALFQAEADPGLPSQSWETFARKQDSPVQRAVEKRTGLQERLDFLLGCLTPDGQWILVEKARHLGRRILLQRALAVRGFRIVEAPRFLSYDTLGEESLDGPLYRVTRSEEPVSSLWSEEPEQQDRHRLYGCQGLAARSVLERLPDRIIAGKKSLKVFPYGDIQTEWGTIGKALAYGWIQVGGEIRGLRVGGLHDEKNIAHEMEKALSQATDQKSWNNCLAALWPSSQEHDDPASIPLYENHTPSAQDIWNELPCRTVLESHTSENSGGRQRHIERGTSKNLTYLYWANTFDQRQLVIMDTQREALLEQYYEESVRAAEQETE